MASGLSIQLVSDLHVDHPANRPRARQLTAELLAHPADVLAVAGDISHRLPQVEETLRSLADHPGRKIWVAGNHDIWIVRAGPREPKDSWAKLDALSDLARAHGFHALEDHNLTVRDHTFVGSIGWYDYSFASPHLALPHDQYVGKKWRDLTYMDAAYARWGCSDDEVTQRLHEALEARLAEAEPPVVYVSHHVPLEELVLRRGHASWDFFNAYMGSRRIEATLRRHRVTRFLFGHTHRPVTLIENGRFVINNPLGYPDQALTPVTRPFRVDGA